MKEEFRELYQQFGLNVVYYRKKKRLSQTQLAVCDALFAEIDAVLVQLDSAEYCALRKYYLDCLKWEQVAADMNFTSRGIFALRRRAIEHLKL